MSESVGQCPRIVLMVASGWAHRVPREGVRRAGVRCRLREALPGHQTQKAQVHVRACKRPDGEPSAPASGKHGQQAQGQGLFRVCLEDAWLAEGAGCAALTLMSWCALLAEQCHCQRATEACSASLVGIGAYVCAPDAPWCRLPGRRAQQRMPQASSA